ncbi:hypothetical protein Tco_1017673 [Tanacetum coccineum]|uniref:Retroviral polymerase SH3-like domain-containing protein n=1 Tax=Tanacetum coccineum TaxID=301880 RepID=A0ABQ5FS45_9ASTR
MGSTILNTKDYLTKFDLKSDEGVFLGYSQNSKAYIILNKHTRKIKGSLNVTFDETPPPSKTSPSVDDELDEEEAVRATKKKNLENVVEDETLEIDEIVNIKESRNHPLENVTGNLNQRTLSVYDVWQQEIKLGFPTNPNMQSKKFLRGCRDYQVVRLVIRGLCSWFSEFFLIAVVNRSLWKQLWTTCFKEAVVVWLCIYGKRICVTKGLGRKENRINDGLTTGKVSLDTMGGQFSNSFVTDQ